MLLGGSWTVVVALALVCVVGAAPDPNAPLHRMNRTQPLQRLAFGSCNMHKRSQHFWEVVKDVTKPDLFLWLGDILYADEMTLPGVWISQDVERVRQKYTDLKTDPYYATFRATTPVIGMWDDHDFNCNDGGKEHTHKDELQEILLDFLDVPADAARRRQRGVYTWDRFGPPGQAVCTLLLDGRYDRDRLGTDGDMLGAEQWAWLDRELPTMRDTCDVVLIGSGVQVLGDEKPIEHWGRFPASRNRFLSLLRHHRVDHAVVLSGDVHLGEIAVSQCNPLGYPLYDFTASGFTHALGGVPGLTADVFNWILPSDRRIVIYTEKNFASVAFDWAARVIEFNLYAIDGHLVRSHRVALKDLELSSDNDATHLCKDLPLTPSWIRDAVSLVLSISRHTPYRAALPVTYVIVLVLLFGLLRLLFVAVRGVYRVVAKVARPAPRVRKDD